MRVALVLAASTGGIGRHVASLAERLVDRGHAVRIFAPPSSVAAHGLDRLGAEVLGLGRLDRVAGADVVHAHGYKAGARAALPAAVAGIPLVVTWHNAVLGSGRAALAGRALQRLVARAADLTLGASSDLVAEARRLGARDARLGPVAAPVLAPSDVPRADARTRVGAGPGDVLVLTISRLAPQKNLGLVLDIARRVRDHPEIAFVIVGEGPLREELLARIRADRTRVRLLGHRDDVPALLAAADLFLLTSTWEARALVAQEALLAGLPLLSTRVGGIEELVGDAATLFAPDDPDAAVRALRRLAADPAERAGRATAGRERARSWPDEDDVAEQLLQIYAELARSAGPGGKLRFSR